MGNKSEKIVFIAGPLTTGWNGKDFSVIEANISKAEEYRKEKEV